MSVKYIRLSVLSTGQSVLTAAGLTDHLRCSGLGFIFGLFISPLLTRTDNFQLPGSLHHVQDPHDPQDHSELDGVSGPEREVVLNSREEKAHQSEDKLAADLTEKVKVLCWVMTGPSNHQAKVTECNMSIILSFLSLLISP